VVAAAAAGCCWLRLRLLRLLRLLLLVLLSL
jgi:hypothetical protein